MSNYSPSSVTSKRQHAGRQPVQKLQLLLSKMKNFFSSVDHSKTGLIDSSIFYEILKMHTFQPSEGQMQRLQSFEQGEQIKYREAL